MLYIFNPNEALMALLKPDFTRSTGPTTSAQAFLSASFPAEFDREPVEGCPYWGAKHREVLNGENIFQFTVPGGLADAEYVREGNLVAFRDLDSYWQFFEISRIVDQHGDGLTRTAYCEHIFYELLDDIVTDKRPSADATAAMVGMLTGTRWQVGIVDDLGNSSANAYYEPVLSALQKVANAWQGELNWRCVITGGVITRYVDLKAMRGTDTGKQFAYSKDILDIEREVDLSSVATALYGRGKGVETESGGYGRRLTFADVTAPDKPAGQEWIGDSDALAQWGRPGGRHRFDVFVDEDETDPEVLLEKTREELARRKVPRVTYRLDVVSLEELTGYEHEQVRLGDLVRVIDREFRPELVVSARVIELERNLLEPENTRVVLGSFAPSIIDATINAWKRIDEISNRPHNTKWLDGKISILQNEIENLSSYVFLTPDDGILIMDAPDYGLATQAIKLGGGIFGIANQKDGQGGWNWRTFGTGAGFTADEINAGTIRADLVQVGSGTQFEEGYDPAGKIKTFYGPRHVEKIEQPVSDRTYWLVTSDASAQRFKVAGQMVGVSKLRVSLLGNPHPNTLVPEKIIWRICTDNAGLPGMSIGSAETPGADWPAAGDPQWVTQDIVLDTPLEAGYYWAKWEVESEAYSQVQFRVSFEAPYADGYYAVYAYDRWYVEYDTDAAFKIEPLLYSPGLGDLLYATDDKEWYRWDGTGWVKTDGAADKIGEHDSQESPHNLPSYCRMQSDGFKVFDGVGNLRAHWGQISPAIFGGKVTHTDGTYTQMAADGFERKGAANWHYHYLVWVGESTTYVSTIYTFYFSIPIWVPEPNSAEVGSTIWGYNYSGYNPGTTPDGTGPGDYFHSIPTSLVRDVEVSLPVDFKGKDFSVFLYLKEVPSLSSRVIYGGVTVNTGPPDIYMAVQSKDVVNGKFTVRAYCRQEYERRHSWFGDGASGDTFRFNVPPVGTVTMFQEWEISRVLQGLDFGYIVIY